MPLFRWGRYIDKKIGELESGEASARADLANRIVELERLLTSAWCLSASKEEYLTATSDATTAALESGCRVLRKEVADFYAMVQKHESRIVPLETDSLATKGRIEQWSKEGFAPGAFSEIAKLRPLIEEQDALLNSTRDIALDSATDLKALRKELNQGSDELATMLSKITSYIEDLAALLDKKPGMSQPVAAQPPRPVLLDIAERPAVRKRS